MENEDGQERKHLATGKRLVELRKKGIVLRSKDLTGGMLFLVIIGLIIFMADSFKKQFSGNFLTAYSAIREVPNNQELLVLVIKKIFLSNIEILLPAFILALITVLISPFLFGGWNFTLDAIQFKLEKLDPMNNLKKMFSIKQTSIEVVRSMFKATLILGVLILFIYYKKVEICGLMSESIHYSLSASYDILKDFIFYISVALIITVAFDVAYHYYQFQTQNKMTGQELKDEQKDTEGSVEVKRKIRSAQIAMFKQRLASSVPTANVIVTNPAHYAIALRYDEKKDHAPRVVAKGKDYLAQQIKQLAIANAIPIYEAPPLARAIYHTTKIGMEIHPELYMAVAIVLSYVHQLKNFQLGIGKSPSFVNHFTLPEEFVYDE